MEWLCGRTLTRNWEMRCQQRRTNLSHAEASLAQRSVCVCVCVSVGGGCNWEMCVACAGKNCDGLWGPHGPIEPHGPMGPTRPIKTYNIVNQY
jgi:hypothetical protein